VGVLDSLNVPLPFATRAVIWVSDTFSDYGIIIVPSMLLCVGILIILCKFTRLRQTAQFLILYTPGFGAMMRSALVARFGIILGSLLKAGITRVQAITFLAEGTEIVRYHRFYRHLAERISVGQSFATAFASMPETIKVLPNPAQQLIITGERSGQIADMLIKTSEVYEKEVDDTAERLPMILEPVLLLGIGGLVGVIAFSILLPIYSIIGNLK
jgi:type IV pilus assembly protein PilC